MLVLDHRLSSCPEGSIYLGIEELSATVANQFKQRVKDGGVLTSLAEVETQLGSPKCSYDLPDGGLKWHYLIENGGAIAVTRHQGTVTVDFSQF